MLTDLRLVVYPCIDIVLHFDRWYKYRKHILSSVYPVFAEEYFLQIGVKVGFNVAT